MRPGAEGGASLVALDRLSFLEDGCEEDEARVHALRNLWYFVVRCTYLRAEFSVPSMLQPSMQHPTTLVESGGEKLVHRRGCRLFRPWFPSLISLANKGHPGTYPRPVSKRSRTRFSLYWCPPPWKGPQRKRRSCVYVAAKVLSQRRSIMQLIKRES